MSNEGELTIHEVYAYLRLHDTAAAIDFYARAFGAKELFRLVEPSGRVGHAEVQQLVRGDTRHTLERPIPHRRLEDPVRGRIGHHQCRKILLVRCCLTF